MTTTRLMSQPTRLTTKVAIAQLQARQRHARASPPTRGNYVAKNRVSRQKSQRQKSRAPALRQRRAQFTTPPTPHVGRHGRVGGLANSRGSDSRGPSLRVCQLFPLAASAVSANTPRTTRITKGDKRRTWRRCRPCRPSRCSPFLTRNRTTSFSFDSEGAKAESARATHGAFRNYEDSARISKNWWQIPPHRSKPTGIASRPPGVAQSQLSSSSPGGFS